MVVGLMALLAGLFLPATGLRSGRQLQSSARVVRATLQAIQLRAITSGRVHRLVIDLDRQRYRVEVLQAEPVAASVPLPTQAGLLDLAPRHAAEDFRPLSERSGDWQVLDDPATWFREVRIGDRTLDQGQVAIAFSPDGGADPASVWLENDEGDPLALDLQPFTGEVTLREADRG